ncbi:unnamed protein product [Moneuplotes crassus]|uniref:Uncharacterized protein n=1 Tax=Euplotes crassus TaxID=5936 RepID=A0AAD1X4V9_EUPCR|nr:unnamed protein product [Moneuplotes crassus]
METEVNAQKKRYNGVPHASLNMCESGATFISQRSSPQKDIERITRADYYRHSSGSYYNCEPASLGDDNSDPEIDFNAKEGSDFSSPNEKKVAISTLNKDLKETPERISNSSQEKDPYATSKKLYEISEIYSTMKINDTPDGVSESKYNQIFPGFYVESMKSDIEESTKNKDILNIRARNQKSSIQTAGTLPASTSSNHAVANKRIRDMHNTNYTSQGEQTNAVSEECEKHLTTIQKQNELIKALDKENEELKEKFQLERNRNYKLLLQLKKINQENENRQVNMRDKSTEVNFVVYDNQQALNATMKMKEIPEVVNTKPFRPLQTVENPNVLSRELDFANIQTLFEKSISKIDPTSPNLLERLSPNELHENKSRVSLRDKSNNKELSKLVDKENHPLNNKIMERKSSIKSKQDNLKKVILDCSRTHIKKHPKALDLNLKNGLQKKRGSIKYFDMTKSTSHIDLLSKGLVASRNQNSLGNLHTGVQTISKKAIIKKPKKGKKSKFKPKNMFLANSKSTKSFAQSAIKVSMAPKSSNKENFSIKSSESGNKMKLSKPTIKYFPVKSGVGPIKNINMKKTRNLYYELKDAMTEKFSHKESLSSSKRNSIHSIQTNSARGSTFEISSYNTLPQKKTIATIKNLPKTTRMADIKDKPKINFFTAKSKVKVLPLKTIKKVNFQKSSQPVTFKLTKF